MRVKFLLISFLSILIFTSPILSKSKNKKLNPQTLKNAVAPVELSKGVLFTYKNKDAEKVTIAGSFNNWDAEKNELRKNRYGIWYIILPLPKGEIQYKFVVDGNWLPDPMNKKTADDGYGGVNSVFEVKKEYDLGGVTILKNGKVRFKYYAPSAKSVFLAGSFNNWSTEADPMKKDENGYWIIEKKLEPGDYQYKYVVDGNWVADPMNKNTADDGYGGVNSVVTVK